MRVARRHHWLAAALAFAMLLTGIAAPRAGLDGAVFAMADVGAPMHMARVAGTMADPCCDDRGGGETGACENSTPCMAVCGKLPLQLAAVTAFFPAMLAVVAARAPDTGRADLSLSPLQRPPKAA
ncbi:MAG: hypothetical protein WD034_00305 [Parvibaculum sp.]